MLAGASLLEAVNSSRTMVPAVASTKTTCPECRSSATATDAMVHRNTIDATSATLRMATPRRISRSSPLQLRCQRLWRRLVARQRERDRGAAHERPLGMVSFLRPDTEEARRILVAHPDEGRPR